MAESKAAAAEQLAADVATGRAHRQTSVMPRRIRNYFLTGLIVAGPSRSPSGLIWWFVNWVDDLVRPFIPPAYRPETYLPWPIPGTGLIIAFVALTLLGFLTANLVGRKLVEFGESLLNRMPIVRPIYKTMKQIFETLFSKAARAFRKVGAGGISGARHVVAGVPVAAAERRYRRATAARPNTSRPSCRARRTRPPAFSSTCRAQD